MSNTSNDIEALNAALAGRYIIERELGAGAMGRVMLARDVTLDRAVAIKLINPELASSQTIRDRFLREARVVAKLRHSNLITVYGAGEAAGSLYFAMEYVDGESLRVLLDREEHCDASYTALLMAQVSDALAHAHGHGVIHRDIKPENIIVDAATKRPMLTDFGIARALAGDGGARITGTGLLVGSPAYMSPEQAAGDHALDGRSDLYSLGLVGFEMLAGDPPFPLGKPAAVMAMRVTSDAPSVSTRVPDVSVALAGVIDRALQRDPDARWPDAAAMAAAADAVHATLAAPAARSRRLAARSSNGGKVRLAAIVSAALLLGAIVWRVIPRTDTAAGQSYLVMPFSIQRGDTSLAWLRQASVDMLSRNLAQWRDVEIVDYEHTLDLLRDASLDTAGAISLRDAVALARRAGVRSVVLGQIEQTADSLSIVVRVFDAGRGDIVRQFPVAAPLSAARDPRSLFDRLSSELLGLDTVRTPLRMNVAKSTTTSVEAYRAYLTGVRLLHAWDLRHADSAFARATRIDTTFALAFSQRSVARGWMAISSEDTLGRAFARRAAGHAEQLPARERALVLAEWDRQEGRLDRARQRYDQLLAEDSSDAQAWYGIGEIHFHAQVASPEDITRTFGSARRAFDRALANDSSFHLAYQHRIDIYSRLALRDVPWILDSDTIRFVHDTTRVRDSARVSASRARASEIAVQTALRWVDNAPAAAPAYAALADAYAAAGKYAEAIATAERAMRGRTTRSTDLPYRLATYHFGAGSTQRALTALDEATRRYGPDSLRRAGSGANWRNLVATINIAAATGSLSQLDKVLGHAIAVDSVWIDRQGRRTPRSDLAFMFRIGSRAALGVLGSRDLRSIDSVIARFEALPEPNGKATRSRHWTIPYVAFISTGESRYLEHLRRWYPNELPLTIRALAALARRDTMEATRLARRLPRSGSVMALTPDGISDPLAQARVLTELGQPRAAIATLESLTPTTLSVLDPDMRWAMYARSLLERGTLYESIGDRSKAIAAYERYIDLMRDADPELRPQVRYAQRHALALRDAPR